MFADEAKRMSCYAVGNVLVLPESFAAALHVADATYAVHDALVVAVTRLQVVEQLRILLARRLAREVLFIADQYRSRLIVVGNVPLLNEDTRRAVSRRSHDVVIVEPDVAKMHRQLSIPVLLSVLVAQAQMPLADGCRSITSVLERIGNRELLRSDNHARITSRNISSLVAESILASQEAIARWRTRGSNRVNIRKAYAALCQRIDVRRLHPCSTKALQVAIA